MDESMETYTNKMSIGEIRCLLVKYGEKSILVTISCIYIYVLVSQQWIYDQ